MCLCVTLSEEGRCWRQLYNRLRNKESERKEMRRKKMNMCIDLTTRKIKYLDTLQSIIALLDTVKHWAISPTFVNARNLNSLIVRVCLHCCLLIFLKKTKKEMKRNRKITVMLIA